MMRSAKMKAIAPEADAARPRHGGDGHVADRAHEAEDGDDGPHDDVLEQSQRRRGVAEEERVEEIVAEQADEAGEQEAEGDLFPQHGPVVAEVVGDVRPRVDRAQALAERERGGGRVVLVAIVRRLGVASRLALERRRDEPAQEDGHHGDQHQPADELGERELPPDQHPHDHAELDHEVGGGELEGQRARRGGALLEQRLGDRDGRVAARRAGRSQACGQRERPCARPAEGLLDALPGRPGLHDR